MKLCLAADLHGHLPTIPDCDLLILAGDYSPTITQEPYWLGWAFEPWLYELSKRMAIIGIAGNHDFAFERKDKPQLPWTYLEDSETTFQGLRIYGTPWQPHFCNWAFNLYEEELAEKHAIIPDGIDILVSHGPPYAHGDLVNNKGHVGSISLLRRIREVRPKLVVCGHIHEGYGAWQCGYIENMTTIINCSIMNEKYQPVNKAWEWEM